jgi:hypothetical protein
MRIRIWIRLPNADQDLDPALMWIRIWIQHYQNQCGSETLQSGTIKPKSMRIRIRNTKKIHLKQNKKHDFVD